MPAPSRGGATVYDLVVLGGGLGGLKVATAAARLGARVALVEKGTSENGCTHAAPAASKALIEAARRAQQIRTAGGLGIGVAPPVVELAAVMARVRAVAAEFTATEPVEALRAQGIDVYRGSPVFE